VDVEEDELERDPTEVLRLIIMGIGLALNAVIMWDFLKERPEVLVMRQRLKNLWARHITNPEKAAKALRRAEGETVFEAINIVEGT
jgi:hypothetical protein